MKQLVSSFWSVSALLLILASLSPVAPGLLASEAAPVGATAPPPAVAASILAFTNAERRRAGVPELEASSSLTTAAQLQAEQMRSAHQMAHDLPGAAYPHPADRLKAVSYPWQAYAENVAMGQKSESEVMSAWMGSSGHRQNLLNPRYTQLGIGYAVDASGRPYYTQVFGQPRR